MTDQQPIEIRDLTAGYGRKSVLRDVTLAVPEASVYVLLGRNGEGKTTLVKCLLGQLQADTGGVRVFGRDAWRGRAQNMRDLAFVPETPEFGANVRVGELVRFLGRVRQRWDSKLVETHLSRLEIDASSRCGTLSRGQKTQLALVTALASEPRLLVCDDPTLGLDAAARKELLDRLIVELAERRTTVLLTTHDLATLGNLADRVGVLHRGSLLVNEAAEGLRLRFRRLEFDSEEASQAAGDLAALAPLSTGRAARPSERIVSRYREDHLPDGCRASSLSLEEVFLALVDDPRENPHA